MNGETFFKFRSNTELLNYAALRIEKLRDEADREDALQESWTDLLESDAPNIEEAKRIFNKAIARIGMRAIRHDRRTEHYIDDMDYIDLGDGNYMRRAHMSPAD